MFCKEEVYPKPSDSPSPPEYFWLASDLVGLVGSFSNIQELGQGLNCESNHEQLLLGPSMPLPITNFSNSFDCTSPCNSNENDVIIRS